MTQASLAPSHRRHTADRGRQNLRLGEILIEQRLLGRDELQAALEDQHHTARQLGRVRRLGRILVDKGYVTEEQVAGALAIQLKLQYVDLRHYSIRPEVVQQLPEIQARRFRAVLLEDGDVCKVGMSDPTDLNAYDELRRTLQRDIEVAVITDTQLD